MDGANPSVVATLHAARNIVGPLFLHVAIHDPKLSCRHLRHPEPYRYEPAGLASTSGGDFPAPPPAGAYPSRTLGSPGHTGRSV